MGLFRRKTPSDLIPIHPDNAANKDWIILLEAGTIVGPSPERIRVARSTQEKKIVKRYSWSLKKRHYVVIEGYNPRIHALYFCPQLYRYDSEKKLVPLEGEEIGRLIAQAHEGRIAERQPWYEPAESLPEQPIIDVQMLTEFDTVVVDLPSARRSSETAG